MSLAVSSRPQYESCSLRSCGRDLRYRDYMAVLAEAGVDPDRLAHDLLLDRESCCTRELLSNLPNPEGEYVERLNEFKSARLVSPPPYYLEYEGEEVRPLYRMSRKHSTVTHEFLGAEPYYYLVERGENPRTVLRHLQIQDEDDIEKIISLTSRPSNEFECSYCGEFIPHAKFLSHLYKTRGDRADILLERPDRVQLECCRDNVMHLKLTEDEKRVAELKAVSLEEKHSGLPIDKEPMEACMSCGDETVRNYVDYEWLIHRGVPPVVALNYFGLNRICCRQSMMNPRIVPRESAAVKYRRLQQEANLPEESTVEFNYEEKKLPALRGVV